MERTEGQSGEGFVASMRGEGQCVVRGEGQVGEDEGLSVPTC